MTQFVAWTAEQNNFSFYVLALMKACSWAACDFAALVALSEGQSDLKS